MRLLLRIQSQGGESRVGAAEKTRQDARAVGRGHPLPDERTEIVGHLQRSLALLRGCEAPGARAQIAGMIGGLTARLHQLESAAPPAMATRPPLSRLIPSATAGELQPLECRSYAIQCESLASMAAPAEQRMLLALARLWRALAQARMESGGG
jgi:hypothetical protein